jgi:hypothetical protein
MLDISLGLMFDIYLEFIVFFFCLASGFWPLAPGSLVISDELSSFVRAANSQ